MEMPEAATREMSQDILAHKISHLSDRDRAVVEALVNSMLSNPTTPASATDPSDHGSPRTASQTDPAS
jgi:hypothetical protein